MPSCSMRWTVRTKLMPYVAAPKQRSFYQAFATGTLEGKRLGAIAALVEGDSLYAAAVEALRSAGAEVLKSLRRTSVSMGSCPF